MQWSFFIISNSKITHNFYADFKASFLSFDNQNISANSASILACGIFSDSSFEASHRIQINLSFTLYIHADTFEISCSCESYSSNLFTHIIL